MTATFETKINAIRTGTVGELTNVVKRVEFTVKGTEQGQSFELPQNVDLADPQSEAFVPLAQVTEANVVEWVEGNFTNMDAVKAHIQMVLDKEVAKAALADEPLPWAPAPAPEPAPAE
jgi:hypothetical protein